MRNLIFQYWRILACLAIVFHHTICLILGEWPPLGYALVANLPDWIESLSSQAKTFGLLSFTFISGAVLAYATADKYTYLQLLWKKTKRILFPALIFGGLYWLLFPSLMYDIWPSPVNGTHLWYLPMIFMCIMLTSIHLYSRNSLLWILPIFFILRKIAMYVDFRTFNEFLYYYPVFYTGYVVNSLVYNPDRFMKSIFAPTRFNCILVICVLSISVVFFSKVQGRLSGIYNIPIALYFSIGYMAVLKTMQYVENKAVAPKMGGGKIRYKIVNIIDGNCLGIYILSQFLLNIWGIYGRACFTGHSVYYVIVIIGLSTFIGALLLSEIYNFLLRLICKRYEK